MAKKQFDNTNKDLSYYLTLYTLEGHTTWRCELNTSKDGFDKSRENQKVGVVPKIIQKNVIRIDRLTGQIIPLP